MLRRQRSIVEAVGHDDFVPSRLGEREAALVLLVDATLDALVGAG